MQLYTSLDFVNDRPCVLALGCFDGVHVGHQAVITSAKHEAQYMGLPLAVFTFSSPPKNFFSPGSTPLITPPEQKPAVFEALGVDICVCLLPSRDIFSMDARTFIDEIICKRLNAACVVCGYNYTFGSGSKGNASLLRSACKSHNITVNIVPEQTLDGQAVSSSLIRTEVACGNVGSATRLLGRPYSVRDTVVNGQHLARTLGFPTVNIVPPHGLLLPKNGVYVSRICFDGACFYGITNVGNRPTVGTEIMCVETHIFDFEGNLYGKELEVQFLHFLREERKFADINQMAEQINLDIATAKKYIEDAGKIVERK